MLGRGGVCWDALGLTEGDSTVVSAKNVRDTKLVFENSKIRKNRKSVSVVSYNPPTVHPPTPKNEKRPPKLPAVSATKTRRF